MIEIDYHVIYINRLADSGAGRVLQGGAITFLK